MNGCHSGAINIGNPDEFTIREVAEIIRKRINPELSFVKGLYPVPSDDPHKRQPIIDLAKKEVNWQPTISLKQGIETQYHGFNLCSIEITIAKMKLYGIIDNILHETIFQPKQLNNQRKPTMRRVN